MKALSESLTALETMHLAAPTHRQQVLVAEAGADTPRALTSLIKKRSQGSVLAVLPKAADGEIEISVSEFAHHTVDGEVEEVARRAAQCQRCAPSGGECATDAVADRPGYFPKWDDGFVWRRCLRYGEFLMQRRLAMMGVPLDLVGKSFESYKPTTPAQRDAAELCREIALQPIRRGVVLIGDTGLGKTHLASAMVRMQVERGFVSSARMVLVPTLIKDIDYRRSHEAQEQAMDRAILSDLLVLDDLGAQRTTTFVQDHLQLIITEREQNRRPIIITTNQPFESFKQSLGDRVYSRLHAMVDPIYLEGDDFRCKL